MLSTVKNLINQKREFVESAEILFEEMTITGEDLIMEGTGHPLTDAIVKGIKAGDDEFAKKDPKNADALGKAWDAHRDFSVYLAKKYGDKVRTGEIDETDRIKQEKLAKEYNRLANMRHGIKTESEELGDVETGTECGACSGGESGDRPIMSASMTDSDDDLFTVSLNPKSGVVTDVLPIPPKNASDAIIESTDDLLGVNLSEPFTENATEPELPTDDLFQEAITMDGGGGSADEPVAEGEKKDGDNEVTAAVKDKVSEVDDGTGDGADGLDAGGGNVDQTAIMNHLDKLQKDILDVKDKIKKELGNQ